MPELQSATDNLMARIAECVAEMDADEAEAFRRANEAQREADKTMGGASVPPAQHNAAIILLCALAVGLFVAAVFVGKTF